MATILVVDDEPAIRDMLKLHLEHYGFKVLTAPDGEQALKQARKAKPDLIVLDLQMPKQDGFDVVKALSSAHGKTRVPVLIMTGREGFEPIFAELGVDAFIKKPFEMDAFLRKVRQALADEAEKTQIFIIDVPTSRHAMKLAEALEKERYKVTAVDSLDTFRRFAEIRRPDYVLIEYLQDETPGDRFIGEVKKILSEHPDKSRKTPVLAYSYSGFDYREKSLRAGADKFLGAPANYGDFITAIREYELSKPQ